MNQTEQQKFDKAIDRYIPNHYLCTTISESSSVGRAQPCQGWGREFESRLSLKTKASANAEAFVFPD